MAENRLPLSAMMGGLMTLMALCGLGIGGFIFITHVNVSKSADHIKQTRMDILPEIIEQSRDSLENTVISEARTMVGSVATDRTKASIEAMHTQLKQLAEQSKSIEKKYDQLRDAMENRHLPLRSISDYRVELQNKQYPKLTYDKSMEGYFYEFGAYLAGECTSCHKISYDFTGIPLIFGLDESYFVGRLNEYKNGQLTNKAMISVAKNLDDEMMLSLALFFKAEEPGN